MVCRDPLVRRQGVVWGWGCALGQPWLQAGLVPVVLVVRTRWWVVLVVPEGR